MVMLRFMLVLDEVAASWPHTMEKDRVAGYFPCLLDESFDGVCRGVVLH